MDLRSGLLVSLFASFAVGCMQQPTQQTQGPNCGPGTVDDNGVCVLVYTPPPGKSLGSGATIYFWASASAGASAQGKVYAIVNGYTQGAMTGYATSGNPSCGTNAIFSVTVGVAPGQSYSLSAHDDYTVEWPPYQTPLMTAGECYSFQLN